MKSLGVSAPAHRARIACPYVASREITPIAYTISIQCQYYLMLILIHVIEGLGTTRSLTLVSEVYGSLLTEVSRPIRNTCPCANFALSLRTIDATGPVA